VQSGPFALPAGLDWDAGVQQPSDDLVIARAGPARQLLAVVPSERKIWLRILYAVGAVQIPSDDCTNPFGGRIKLVGSAGLSEQSQVWFRS
jgi:hypothetical protein